MSNIVFGPVPSRRLGLSLGVNNVFSKYCSYSCIYCQIGRTTMLTIKRRKFYEPLELVDNVVKKVSETKPDVITFVPNGEPTLDINLGREAELIRSRVEKPLAILTNASLLFREDVASDLELFDIVSIKIDAVNEYTWKVINRPHQRLDLNEILNGIRVFAKKYRGRLLTETMLIDGVNNSTEHYRSIAEFLRELKPFKTYIQAPIRPPAEQWVKAPSEEDVVKAYGIFIKYLGSDRVELLIAPEPPRFIFTGDLVYEIAKTIQVHPMRLDYIQEIARDKGLEPEHVVNELVNKGYARIVRYYNTLFLVPRIRK